MDYSSIVVVQPRGFSPSFQQVSPLKLLVLLTVLRLISRLLIQKLQVVGAVSEVVVVVGVADISYKYKL
jgi:hypothetical protein